MTVTLTSTNFVAGGPGSPGEPTYGPSGVFGDPPQPQLNTSTAMVAATKRTRLRRRFSSWYHGTRPQRVGGCDVGLSVGRLDQWKLRKVLRIRGLIGRIVGTGSKDLIALLGTDRRRLLARLRERPEIVGQRQLLGSGLMRNDGIERVAFVGLEAGMPLPLPPIARTTAIASRAPAGTTSAIVPPPFFRA